MDWKLELVAVPVSDVDRAKRFYTEQVGFNADHDQRRANHHDGAGGPLTVVSQQPSRRRWSVRSYPLWACGSCWAGSCPSPAGRI